MFEPPNVLPQKNFYTQNILTSKIIYPQKMLIPQIIWPQKIVYPQKFSGHYVCLAAQRTHFDQTNSPRLRTHHSVYII